VVRGTSALCGVTVEDGLADCYVNSRSLNRFPRLLRCLWSLQIMVLFRCPGSENGLFSGISMLHIVSLDLLKSSMRC
jgi:hypothetical protein